MQSRVDALVESEALAKRQRHDLRHHNITIAQFAKNKDFEGLLHYLNVYDEFLDSERPQRYCINEVANNVIAAYINKAELNGIETEISAIVSNEVEINAVDIVAIIANILENAINGCMKSSDKPPIIEFMAYERDGKLVIKCKNSSAGGAIFENGIPKSKTGGLGIDSIKSSVVKYAGDMHFEEDGTQFSVKIILNV